MKTQQQSSKMKFKNMLKTNWGREEDMRKELFLLKNYVGTKANE